ncbi:signal peptidase I [Thiocystis violascens]|uniref:Signal peptidase I n=1 Tax=Thiocystis violascens (strain ATCC 17096 / DSM 198 / 6111) TaxID=765911 RepID=I3Y6P5_THIV6|nr:signal peptidase I [Thiocystis violascens]AFL72663.1 signal peptidase I [Thiocystis violascens DSM 198]
MTFDFPAFLVLASVLTGGIWLIDALLFAPRRRRLAEAAMAGGARIDEGRPLVREPVLVEYARSFFPVIFAVLILRSFIVEPFRIPSNSMMPTLLTGDFILVNKFAYGLRLPVLNRKFVELGEPRRGDVLVFKFPLDPKTDYIKRVIGLPGDEIDYRNKTVFVNGEPMGQLPIGAFSGEGSGTEMTGAREALESLDGVEHRILTRSNAPNLPFGCQKLALGPIRVPPGHYFVMGDNRDNSNDSRCWGFVPDANLVGKAFAIWMHWDSERDGLPIAWSRLGDGIH